MAREGSRGSRPRKGRAKARRLQGDGEERGTWETGWDGRPRGRRQEYVSGERGRDILRRACPARVQGQVRKPTRAQLPCAGHTRRAATGRDRFADRLHATETGDARGHQAAGSSVYQRSGAVYETESVGGKNGQIFL